MVDDLVAASIGTVVFGVAISFAIGALRGFTFRQTLSTLLGAWAHPWKTLRQPKGKS
jgi:hypothetical protein